MSENTVAAEIDGIYESLAEIAKHVRDQARLMSEIATRLAALERRYERDFEILEYNYINGEEL
jgi:hypothetical protein